MNYSVFEKILTNRVIGYGFISTIAFLVGLIGVIYSFKNMREEKVEFYTVNFLCIGLIIGSFVFFNACASELMYDIKNQAYIVWNGEFTVDKHQSSGDVFIYIPDENGIKLESGDWPEAGKHTGTVIYGEKSKVVLDIKINDKMNEPIILP